MPVFLSTLLIGLTTAVVGSYLQHRSWRNANLEQLRRTEFTEAKAIVHELSKAVDYRLEATRHFSIATSRKESVEEARKEYVQAVSEWMRSFNTFKSNIFLYFGRNEMLRFELEVHAHLKRAGDIIARTVRYRDKGWTLSRAHRREFDDIDHHIALAREAAFFQLRTLNDRIAAGEYGTIQHVNNLEVREHSKITHTFLVQRLLGIKSTNPRLTYE